MPNSNFDNTIKSIFDLSDEIFEAMYTPSDQRYNRQHKILKQLRETQLIEHYKRLETNLQAMYTRSDEIFDKQHEELKKIKHKFSPRIIKYDKHVDTTLRAMFY